MASPRLPGNVLIPLACRSSGGMASTLPSTGGEADIAQYLQVLPGVISTGDQGGQIYIRGGSPIQNKVFLRNDGSTVIFAGSVDNTGSTLALESGPTWQANFARITGGVLSGSTLTVTAFDDLELDGVTVNNDIVLKVGDFGPMLTREASKPSPARTIVKWTTSPTGLPRIF